MLGLSLVRYAVYGALGALALAALVFAVHTYNASLVGAGYDKARTEAQARELRDLRAFNTEKAKLEAELKAAAEKYSTEQSQAARNYENRLGEIELRRAADVNLRLRDPGAKSTCTLHPVPTTAGPAARELDGSTTGELSPAFTRLLSDLVNEADRNTEQLTALQVVTQRLWETCNGR